jgi:hypothetical protein
MQVKTSAPVGQVLGFIGEAYTASDAASQTRQKRAMEPLLEKTRRLP